MYYTVQTRHLEDGLLSGSSFTIGVTGHRCLPTEGIAFMSMEIQAYYKEEVESHGARGITLLSSLAEGADTMCAKLALDAGFRLIAPLPLTALEYRNEFSKSAAVEFDCLLSLADNAFVVSPEEEVPVNPQLGFFYRQAGIYVAKHCDALLAVWDGVERDAPDGAGTWETIKLARLFGKPIRVVAPFCQ